MVKLYHGSDHIIKSPSYLGGKPDNDYGNGFYTDEFIMEWMADIYTYLQWKYNLLSQDIVKKIQPKELYLKYYPLHETSIENGVEKLVDIYF